MNNESKAVRFYKAPMIIQTTWDRIIYRGVEVPPVAANVEEMVKMESISVTETSHPIREYRWHDEGQEFVSYLAFQEEEDYDVFRRVCEVNHRNERVIRNLRDEIREQRAVSRSLDSQVRLYWKQYAEARLEIQGYEYNFNMLRSFWQRLKFLFRGRV